MRKGGREEGMVAYVKVGVRGRGISGGVKKWKKGQEERRDGGRERGKGL